ncbi:hypothetical protein E2320_000238 [Naja naja]|nr:hypothetical protein E2320_000238 [Naja naja]
MAIGQAASPPRGNFLLCFRIQQQAMGSRHSETQAYTSRASDSVLYSKCQCEFIEGLTDAFTLFTGDCILPEDPGWRDKILIKYLLSRQVFLL